MYKWLAAVAILLAVIVGGAWWYRVFHEAPPPSPVAAPIAPAAPSPVHAVIGTSVQGRAIDAYTYGSGPTRLFFVGGMHGGYEWNAVALAWQFKEYLDAHPELVPAGESVTVIPDLNPDGVYEVTHKEGPIAAADVLPAVDTVPARLNADGVDLNRNFDCRWQPGGTWQNKPVSAGTAPFSEPESKALRDFILADEPAAVIFWHSASGTVYGAECGDGPAPHDLDIMRAYADAAGYQAQATFDAYPVSGDAESWLASIGIPAITVELTDHAHAEWDKNLAGIEALIQYVAQMKTAATSTNPS